MANICAINGRMQRSVSILVMSARETRRTLSKLMAIFYLQGYNCCISLYVRAIKNCSDLLGCNVVMSKHFEWVTPDSDLLELEKTELSPPSMYHVMLNNDDYTPMDFVVEILERFFAMELDKANQVMLQVHYEGKASCGVFSAEVAETKVAQVMVYAKENEHPLLCTMERA